MKVLATVLAAAAMVSAHGDHAHAHDGNATHAEHKCGTHVEQDEVFEATRIADELAEKVCSVEELQHLRICQPLEARLKRPVVIPVWYHVVHSGTTGRLTEQQIVAQFEQTQKDFAGEEDPRIPGYAKMDITFRFAGSTYTDNAQWFNDIERYETEIKQAVAVDNTYNFNQYFGNFGAGLLGFCYFPNSFAESSFRHGCMNLYSSVPGGSSTNYNQGKTTTHETGHGIGLYHTFQGGCNGGDQVPDTCNQASPTNGCPTSRTSCNNPSCPDPINNYMDYSFDRCMTQFTPGQNTRANNQLFTFRPSLYGTTEEEKQLVEKHIPGAWGAANAFARESEERYMARRLAKGFN